MAQFSRILNLLDVTSFDELSDQERILYIECLARTSQGKEAERLLAGLTSKPSLTGPIQTVSGMVDLSLGRFDQAEDHVRKALSQDPDSAKAKMTEILLRLYLRDHQEAQRLYKEFRREHPDWAGTYLVHLMGIEVFGAAGHFGQLSELYRDLAARIKSEDKDRYENCRKNSRLYQKPPGQRAFEFASAFDKVEWPFSAPLDKTRCPTVTLKTKDGPFTIVLDTGNRAGWMIHSRELAKRLKSKIGGMGLVQIGTEENFLHGPYILTEKLELGHLSLMGLAGMYIPKPHPSYADANLNPLFMKDCVITLDFIKEALILRSRERFQTDLDEASPGLSGPLVLPWVGYEEAFIPVTINGNTSALALLETGAGDITLRLDFAKYVHMPIEPAVRSVASGKQFAFHRTSLSLDLGPFRIDRPAAEVWALDRYADPLSGFAPDVILGPDFFKKRWAVSFDPFGRKIVLSDYSH